MSVDPVAADIQRLMAEDPGGPVVMLNLLRYKPDGGRERYAEYGAAAAPFLEKVGGRLLYAGDASLKLVGPDAHRWDTVLIVEYPSRQAFLDMVGDPDYFAITHIRTEALEEAVLEATVPWPAA
jgi:uncharacterized protein (DUF1330 family)